ncbi:MAG TPA: hypothetical protein GYA07_02445 [Verrucomicrobia bacterium]|mgnify:CR=1 FL=1|nr:hypothetical protein [Verrucomicrobiota bacterium]HOP97924.1 cation:proton antiporter [Verrucomicrobiota bacterium]
MIGIDFIQDLGLVMLIAAAAGWLCQRAGLPVVIGYLSAGILIGPQTSSFGLISDPARVQSLAQIGLVFLIFSIGTGLRLQRLRKMGLPLVVGTALIAGMVLVGCKLLGTVLGWPAEHSLVLAGILMVSSTAVLGKTLRDSGLTHSRFGQTALTVTALDDLVAVITLTVLTSLIHVGHADSTTVFGSVVRLNAVVVTMVIVALLSVPALLSRVRTVSSEVRSLVIVGLLLAMALLSAKAGFSAALGAFLLGTIVSSTGSSDQVDRTLSGLTEVFAPVFFVAMGMLFDYRLFAEAWPLALGVFAMAVVWRALSATVALLMVGHSMGDAARAGVSLTPIGEFSLIIALTGVQGGLVPETFYAVAIGVCLLTSFTTPFLIQRSRGIGEWVVRRQPERLAQWIGLYHDWIESLKQRRKASLLWTLTAPRLIQVGLLVLFVSGLLIFARPLYAVVAKWLGPDWPVPGGLAVTFWLVFGILLLAPLIAVWRSVEALAMICAEAATQGHPKRSKLRPLFENLLKASALASMVVWLAALVPYTLLPGWGMILLALAFVGAAAVFWRKWIRFQSRFEIELRRQLTDSPFGNAKPPLVGMPSSANGRWELILVEHVVKDGTRAVARAIAELPLRSLFSCTIVSIERQGVPVHSPPSDTVLYPNDKVLLLGPEEGVRAAGAWLDAASDMPPGEPGLAELRLEHLTVPAGSRHVGKTLGELGVNSLFGVQVVGIQRDHRALLGPGGRETLQPNDQLLVLGAPERVNEMAFWLST